MDRILLKQEDIATAGHQLAGKIDSLTGGRWSVWGVPRGGIPVAYLMRAYSYNTPRIVDKPEDATVIVDDLCDSGKTWERYSQNPARIFGVLYTKRFPAPVQNQRSFVYGQTTSSTKWLVFPWEQREDGTESSGDDIVTRLLQFIGEDPTRGGLVDTPRRVLSAWKEWTSGYAKNATDIVKCFDDGAEKSDEMIIVRDIPIYSHCEHHLAPFFGVAHVAYVPDGKIIGISKIPRIVDVFAKRLQVQERLTNEIADAILDAVKPKGIGVVVECRHLCMESRGVRVIGSKTITSALRGVIKEKPAARSEFLELIR